VYRLRAYAKALSQASTHAPARPRPKQKTPENEVVDHRSIDSDDETAVEDDEDDDDDDDIPKDAEVVIPHLASSKEPIVMTTTHNNSIVEKTYGNESIQAFAKVSGREWTYYVQAPIINFGREQAPQHPQSTDGAATTGQERDDEATIHIDLGPSKVVSRIHASIKYGQVNGHWHLEVFGRNGAKIDDEDLRKGQVRPLHSGTVITIAGTEMLFQIAEQEAQIHQKFIDRVFKYDEELDGGGMYQDPGASRPPPIPYYPMSGPLHNGGPPLSHYPVNKGGYYGQRNIAPAPVGMIRQPVTPTPSPPKQAAIGSTKKRSPGGRRGINGMMMESTEQIDYALESSKAIKPACSYAAMITWAILSAPEQCLSLAGIYLWIKAHYAFYRHSQGGWQVREKLSLESIALMLTHHRTRFDTIFP